MRNKLLIMMVMVLLATSACAGGTGGSVSGSRQSCQSKGGSTTCEGRINKLSGTYSHEVETSAFNAGDVVLVEAQFAIESGQLKVTIEVPDGSLMVVEVFPGTPAVLSGLATVESSIDENAVPLTLQSQNGAVEGVSFIISIRQP